MPLTAKENQELKDLLRAGLAKFEATYRSDLDAYNVGQPPVEPPIEPPIEPPVEPPTEPPPTSGDTRHVILNWGNPPIDTRPPGVGIGADTTLICRLLVPAGSASPLNQPGTISVVEYDGPPVERIMSLSIQPGDFRGWTPGQNFPPGDPSSSARPMAWSGGINPNMQFLLQGNPVGFPPKPLLVPGRTYYVNMRSAYWSSGAPSCPQGGCNVRITVNPPR